MRGGVVHQIGLMLRAPWQWRRNEGEFWTFVLLLLSLGAIVGLMSASGALASGRRWQGAALAVLVVLGGVGLVAVWATQFAALMRLDQPHAAHLVPGYQPQLRRTALALWLLLVVLSGLLAACLALMRELSWVPVLAITLCMAAMLLYVASCLRWWWLWMLPAVLPIALTLQVLRPWRQGAAEQVSAAWQAQPGLATVMALALMAALLWSLFGRGNTAHARAYARREQIRRMHWSSVTGEKSASSGLGGWAERLLRPWQALTDRWLEHLLTRAQPGPASAMARAEPVLYGAHGWVSQISGALMAQLLLGLVAAWALIYTATDLAAVVRQSQIGLSIGLTMLAVQPLMAVRGALWSTRREQALLQLLPGMPRGAVLNQSIARLQLLRYLMNWVATMPLLAGLVWWSGVPELLGFAGAGLLAAPLLWCDVARLRAPQRGTLWLWPLACMAVGLVFTLLLRWQPGWMLPWFSGVLVLTAVLLAWRWRRLAQWPQALPAGRLS